jgi:hypothetical protein
VALQPSLLMELDLRTIRVVVVIMRGNIMEEVVAIITKEVITIEIGIMAAEVVILVTAEGVAMEG